MCLQKWGFEPKDMLGYLRATRHNNPIRHDSLSSNNESSSNEGEREHWSDATVLSTFNDVYICTYSPGPKGDAVGDVAENEKCGAVDGMGLHPGADVRIFGTHDKLNQMQKC